MTEEELNAKIRELEAREGELQKKESELEKREADAERIGETIKGEYEKRMEEQKAEYEKRISTRDSVIRQLSSGESERPRAPSFIDRMNERRNAQNKKW